MRTLDGLPERRAEAGRRPNMSNNTDDYEVTAICGLCRRLEPVSAGVRTFNDAGDATSFTCANCARDLAEMEAGDRAASEMPESEWVAA